MCFDDRHRKVYIADAMGIVRCFNVNSGSLINIIHTCDVSGDEHATLNDSTDLISKEILAMRYYTHADSFILVTCHINDTVKAWDVSQSESTELIKISQGGHSNENISVMEISDHLCMFATGSFAGEIVVWDFETFLPIGQLKGHKSTVKSIQFVEGHALLVSGCGSGIICVHSVRGGPVRLINTCLGKFVNLELHGESYMNIGIASMLIFYRKNED